MKRNRPEQELQKTVIEHLRLRGWPDAIFFHYPAGGYRRPAEARILAGLGVLPGLPDVWVIRRGRVHCIELKSERGRLTEIQADMHNRLSRAGVDVAVAYSLDQALDQLERWKLLKGTAQ
jgi:VRR-NUC domain